METEKYYGTFYNAETGETIDRELTAEEIAVLVKVRQEVSNVVAD
jgi:hypothetical protein